MRIVVVVFVLQRKSAADVVELYTRYLHLFPR